MTTLEQTRHQKAVERAKSLLIENYGEPDNGTEEDYQRWNIRLGVLIAFLDSDNYDYTRNN